MDDSFCIKNLLSEVLFSGFYVCWGDNSIGFAIFFILNYQIFINSKTCKTQAKAKKSSGPPMPKGPPGMIVAPSGAVFKPEECGVDGDGNGWCSGESVPAEWFMKERAKFKPVQIKSFFQIIHWNSDKTDNKQHLFFLSNKF